MNENALHVEMGIPLLSHPKHTYSKIGGLTDSESEYSSNSERELDNLIPYSKQVEFNSPKNSKSDQNSFPNLVIYATPQGRTVHLGKTQDPNTSGSKLADLPYQQSTPLHPSSSKHDQEVQDLCREILMVRISEEPEGDPMERLNLTTTALIISTSTFPTTWKLLLPQSPKPKLPPRRTHPLLLQL
jgi:hypothetical protein